MGEERPRCLLLTALPRAERTGWGDDWYRLHWDGETAVVVHHLRGDDSAATERLVEALLARCRTARLGDAFVVLRAGPDAAYVASLDRAATQSFTAGLAEHGYEVTGSC